jgi:RNA polymerase sigma factor (sigma-70 family)
MAARQSVALKVVAALDQDSAEKALALLGKVKGVDGKGSTADVETGVISVKLAGGEKLTADDILSALAEGGIKAEIVTAPRSVREEAALQVFLRYQGMMASLVRRWLDERIRQPVGTDAIVQSAWTTFDKAARQADPDDFVTELLKATRKKAKKHMKRFTAEKRDFRRLVRERSDEELPDLELFGPDPTAEEAAIFVEMRDSLNRDDQMIVDGLMEGRTYEEIGEVLDCSKTEVWRRVKALREKLKSWLKQST